MRRHFPAVLVFAAAFALYLQTLCPTVYVGDSAEFIATSTTLGINHPTGYPLTTLLTRVLMMLLPFTVPAVAANIFSALAAAATVAGFFKILEILAQRRVLAAGFSMLLAVSSTLWSHATSAEVYTLGSFFLTLTLAMAVRWSRDRSLRDLAFVAFLSGLGLSQHSTTALAIPGIALFVVVTEPQIIRRPRALTLLGSLFVIGLSSYLYLPIRAIADPAIAWGTTGTLDGFLRHLLPVSERGLAPYFGGSVDTNVDWLLRQALTREFWTFGGIALLGVPVLLKQWRLLVLLGSITLVNIVFAVTRSVPVHADFDAMFIPSFLVMTLSMGVGVEWILREIRCRWTTVNERTINIGVSAALFLIVAITAFNHYEQHNKGANYFGFDFGKNLYLPLEKDALVFTTGDEQCFLAWFFKYVEKSHPGATFIDARILGTSWGIRSASRALALPLSEVAPVESVAAVILRSAVGQRPVYFTHRVPWNFVLREYDMVPVGMLLQILPRGTSPQYLQVVFEFHGDVATLPLDERCILLSGFYLKHQIDHAQFWINNGNPEAAQKELATYFTLPFRREKADDAKALLLQSYLDAQAGNFHAAIARTDSVLIFNPREWRALEYRGNFRFLRGETAAAMSDWGRSLELNPENSAVRMSLERVARARRGGIR